MFFFAFWEDTIFLFFFFRLEGKFFFRLFCENNLFINLLFILLGETSRLSSLKRFCS